MNDKNYKITAISPGAKDWQSAYGPMKTYRVKLDLTNDEVLELNKKAENVPQVGDELFGHVEDSKNPEFPTRKFKSVSRFPQAQGGNQSNQSKYAESPEKQSSIYRSVALNDAALVYQGSGEGAQPILDLADAFNQWLENKPEKAPETATDKFEFSKDDDIKLETEEVDLSEIPF